MINHSSKYPVKGEDPSEHDDQVQTIQEVSVNEGINEGINVSIDEGTEPGVNSYDKANIEIDLNEGNSNNVNGQNDNSDNDQSNKTGFRYAL